MLKPNQPYKIHNKVINEGCKQSKARQGLANKSEAKKQFLVAAICWPTRQATNQRANEPTKQPNQTSNWDSDAFPILSASLASFSDPLQIPLYARYLSGASIITTTAIATTTTTSVDSCVQKFATQKEKLF